jgi:hypothetical protein
MRPRTSREDAPPRLTMKFACMEETRPPPHGISLEPRVLDDLPRGARELEDRRIVGEHGAAVGLIKRELAPALPEDADLLPPHRARLRPPEIQDGAEDDPPLLRHVGRILEKGPPVGEAALILREGPPLPASETASTERMFSPALCLRLPPFMVTSPPREPGMPAACSKPDNPASARFFTSFGTQIPPLALTSVPAMEKSEKSLPSFITTPRMPPSGKSRFVPFPMTRKGTFSPLTNSTRRMTSSSVRGWTRASAGPPIFHEQWFFSGSRGETTPHREFPQRVRKDHGRFRTAFRERRTGLLPSPDSEHRRFFFRGPGGWLPARCNGRRENRERFPGFPPRSGKCRGFFSDR